MSRYRVGIILVGVGALALAGCSSSTGGDATFATTTTAPTSTASQIAQQLQSLDPCSVLSFSDANKLHLVKKGRDDNASANSRGCGWDTDANVVGATNEWGFTFSILLDNSATDVNTQGVTVKQVSTNGRSGLQLDGHDGTCVVTMAITNTSAAMVTTSSTNQSQACSYATDVAALVEPKLPKG